jgi:hypothetical protein
LRFGHMDQQDCNKFFSWWNLGKHKNL